MFFVTKIQRFCTKDGPGIRTTVFLKGCPLRCVWCHNPETQSTSAQFFYVDQLCIHCGTCAAICHVHSVTDNEHLLDRATCNGCMKCVSNCPTGALENCAKWLSEEELYNEIMKDTAFYSEGGGITFSGGEPTVYADKLIPLLNRIQEKNIHTAIETCGYFNPIILPQLVKAVNLFLWDIKDTNNARHISNTGVSNEPIIKNLKTADSLEAKTVLRCILLKSVNLNADHLKSIADIYHSLNHCSGVELIPYHTYGASKSIQLGLANNAHREWIPSENDIYEAKELLQQYAVPVINN